MVIMTKVPEYPRIHEFDYQFGIPVESATANFSTICPIIAYDEGLGVINSFKTNPQNASFVESASANNYPTSRINNVYSRLQVSMNKIMLETDKLSAVKFATALIHTSFMDGQLAEDEVSGLDLNEILELQNESTDRQTGPLYNAVDLPNFKGNAELDMPTDQAFLDTDVEIEAVGFVLDDYYDCLHYYTNGKKLRTICTPLKWHTLTRNNMHKDIFFSQQSNTKYMNPYTFLGVLIHVPDMQDKNQFGSIGDTTVETSKLEFGFHCRYNEFNHEFNHSLQ